VKTILILEDEQDVRESISYYFEDRLWQPLQVESAEQALELLRTVTPDAAVVDVRLPGIDGNDFIRKASQLSPITVFVICTGSLEYCVPPDMERLPGVSNHLFKKPLARITKMEKEILLLLQSFHRKETGNE
jgi:response regulator RpfG family c-di-GMP phosphodiesterase